MYRYKDQTSEKYKSLSWNEVFKDVERLAKSLLSEGYGFESMIGIFSSNKPEWAITDYGILAIRGVTVPFFGTATKEQVKYIVDETKMEIIFVGNKEQFDKAFWLFEHSDSLKKIIYYSTDVQSIDPRCISWDDFLAIGDDEKQNVEFNKLIEEAKPDDLATLLYTSGTTGEPKGVMLTHDNFMYCFELHKDRLDVMESDVSMCFLPLSHVFERTWSYYMMYCGVENVILENPRTVIEELPKTNPTVMCTVPRFFEKTYEGIQKEYNNWSSTKQKVFDWSIKTGHESSAYKSKNKKLPSLLSFKKNIADRLVLGKLRNIFGANMRTMPCSGAAIRPELLRFFHATGMFVNYGYGATETTATVSCFRTDLYDFDSCGSVMNGVEVKIGDENEILVKGRTVFKGYYNKPKETEEVLKDGWYATGDEGKVLPDNMLLMSDRIKDLFKTSGGKYVSPQKLELLIGQNNFIEQVVVFGDSQKYITALIVPSIENLTWVTKKMGISSNSLDQLIKEEKVKEFYESELQTAQEELAPFEKVVKFTLVSEPFSVENKSLTSTLKIRRKIIQEVYKETIEAMYAS